MVMLVGLSPPHSARLPKGQAMPDVQWFNVGLEKLDLRPVEGGGWPAAMRSTRARMCEECLESLVALNLDALFPGEELLLLGTQSQIQPVADVTAIDRLGILRL